MRGNKTRGETMGALHVPHVHRVKISRKTARDFARTSVHLPGVAVHGLKHTKHHLADQLCVSRVEVCIASKHVGRGLHARFLHERGLL